MLTPTSEHPSYEDKCEIKSQANISPYNKYFEQPEEELIEFKKKNKWNQKSFHQKILKMKCLLSLLKLYLINIYLIPS